MWRTKFSSPTLNRSALSLETATGQLGMLKEGQIDPGQVDEIEGWIRLTASNDEGSGVVVGAEAVLGARGHVESVLP